MRPICIFLLPDLSQKVYEKLQAIGVPVPRYVVLRRDETNCCDDPGFTESEDTIRVHGMVFHKPFVEKPLSAEDHNVYIYFPSQAGGGCQQLFRKIGSLSSRYCDQSQVRKSGSYIYENFMPTEGTDVKVSTSFRIQSGFKNEIFISSVIYCTVCIFY